MYQQASEGGVRTHGGRNSVCLHYSVYSFRDSLYIWDKHLTLVVFVLCPTLGRFCFVLSVTFSSKGSSHLDQNDKDSNEQ